MRLDELVPEALGDLAPEEATTLGALTIHAVHQDSRRVMADDLFFAIRGLTVDGHAFATRAATAGAVAVIGSDVLPDNLPIPYLRVEDPVKLLGLAASRLHHSPCASLRATGITGTNGKTTTAYLLEGMLAAAGHTCGLVGTVAYRYGDRSVPAPFTTPTPVELQTLLGEMVMAGCDHLVMEVSSHGLSLGRVWGCDYDVAAFTHLTQDHLDLHGSMDAYLDAKRLLFSRHLLPGGVAVVNVDGQGADAILATLQARGDIRVLGCSRRDAANADLRLGDLTSDLHGLKATVRVDDEEATLRSPLLGTYNADNLLLAIGCAHALGVDLETACAAAPELPGVPGRLERVDGGRDFAVLVDYAHTPDALARALEVLRPVCPGRLLCVFGSGGDRDRSKRPLMGRAVAKGADIALVTSDNPRHEDPLAIIDAILPGMEELAGPRLDIVTPTTTRGYWVDADRHHAIEVAINALVPGDILLIAGKGHEDYQILGDKRIHFDDREEARRALVRRDALGKHPR
ncbi:MAG: UDP-N-acetylmuramoyl-L-alanyl-D-glutamate--2,6-diaminopimelate ligase [Deltaproteobacteria bacterium]|nr:UDP-N-acetylmuramoyl-L-alanyl-D-glutamate--2,6-diaminopimelate ligase [Deltaproteobacteria bacterium]